MLAIESGFTVGSTRINCRAAGMLLFAALVVSNLYEQATNEESYAELDLDNFPDELDGVFAITSSDVGMKVPKRDRYARVVSHIIDRAI
jgi:hypothetical protein